MDDDIESEGDGQVELFAAGDISVRHDLVDGVKEYAHTGRTTCRDGELCQAMAEALLAGVSIREIARTFHVGRHTIRAVIQVMEASGKLAPLKQRMSSKLGYAIELGIENSIELLQRGKVPANILPVMVGVFADKKAMLDGDATVVVEHRRAVSLEDLRAKLEEIKRVKGSATTVAGPGQGARKGGTTDE